MNTEHLLDIKNLKVQFQNHQILSGISFRVVRGEVIAVIGRSGSGKTVLLRTIANLIKANEGEINFHFRNLNATSPIGFVFQKSPLFPWLTVAENLTLCANGEIEKSYAAELLKNVGLEKVLHDIFPAKIVPKAEEIKDASAFLRMRTSEKRACLRASGTHPRSTPDASQGYPPGPNSSTLYYSKNNKITL